MPEHGHGHRPPPDTSTRLEQSDLSVTGILKGVVFYFVFTALMGVIVLVGIWGYNYFISPPLSPVANKIPTQPNPLLQNNITAKTDIWNLRTYEDHLLHSTSYVDQNAGIVRVPVDQALDEIAAKGPDALNLVPVSQQTNIPGPGPGGAPAPASAGTVPGTPGTLPTSGGTSPSQGTLSGAAPMSLPREGGQANSKSAGTGSNPSTPTPKSGGGPTG